MYAHTSISRLDICIRAYVFMYVYHMLIYRQLRYNPIACLPTLTHRYVRCEHNTYVYMHMSICMSIICLYIDIHIDIYTCIHIIYIYIYI